MNEPSAAAACGRGPKQKTDRSLPGFEDRSSPDHYCDLVLTGGVTSAIAYPGAIHGLAQVYRFNAIGGSSSGAGLAALAAAAEYRRRHGSTEGFRTLLRRTSELKNSYGGKTGLAWIFQPDYLSRRLFKLLLPTFAGPTKRPSALFASLIWVHWASLLLPTLVTAVLVIAAAGQSADRIGWGVAALLANTMLALLWTAWRIWVDVKVAADDDYGLCSGQQRESGAMHPPLTPWLHDLLQDIAGLPPNRPLTFADLHAAPGAPRETLGDASLAGAKSIDLRMFAADVTQGRPLLLPLQEDDPKLYFRPRELRRLFPDDVVDAMMARPRHMKCSAAKAIEPVRATSYRRWFQDPDEDDLWELPRLDLPVLVAARMSVSFPILFSAVPLWQCTPDGQNYRRLLFADGGLCSNFPIHLFDSPIPAWPTFGVALFDGGGNYSTEPECIARRVTVPETHRQMPADRWSKFDQQDKPRDRLTGFVGAMLWTVKDWNDALLSELPGVRERIAEVSLPENIGGLNILMDADQIECLGLLGGEVARKLLKRYAVPDGSGGHAPGWREHRWVRFNILCECLQQSLVGLSRAAQHARYAEPLSEQIRKAIDVPPLSDGKDTSWQPSTAAASCKRRGQPSPDCKKDEPLLPAHAAALERTLDALLQIERALTPLTVEQPYKPKPKPVLRTRPPM